MANKSVWESSVKLEQPSSMDAYYEGLKIGSSRPAPGVHNVLGDPRVAVGLPVSDQLTAASNLQVNNSN